MENETLDTLKAYMQLADQLVEHATKEQLGECARILALNVAHYTSRYGGLPLEERLDFLHATDLSEEQAKLVERGLQTFVGVLGNMMGDEAPRHWGLEKGGKMLPLGTPCTPFSCVPMGVPTGKLE